MTLLQKENIFERNRASAAFAELKKSSDNVIAEMKVELHSALDQISKLKDELDQTRNELNSTATRTANAISEVKQINEDAVAEIKSALKTTNVTISELKNSTT